MSNIESHKDLDVYKKGYQLALEIYRLTLRFPTDEKYGLTDQLRRAAVSIPSNIAEGFRRFTHADFVRFLRIAYGSSSELDTQLELCSDLGILGKNEYLKLNELNTDVSKMLHKLIVSLG